MKAVLPAEQNVHENIDERDGEQDYQVANQGASLGWYVESWWPPTGVDAAWHN